MTHDFKAALEGLILYQQWRRGSGDIEQPNPRVLGDIIDTAIETLHQAHEQRWRPIEDIPEEIKRAGTRILVFNGDNEGYHTYVGDIGVAEWDVCLGRKQWVSVSCCDGVSYFIPTHWMPLPPAPTAQEGGGDE